MSNRMALRLLAAGTLQLVGMAPPAAAGLLWQTDWTRSAPPTLAFFPYAADPAPSPPVRAKPSAAAVFAADGDVLLGGPAAGEVEFQFVRLDAAGQLKWSAHIDEYDGAYPETPQAMLATDDGGAIVSLGDHAYSGSDRVFRIDATGHPLWFRSVPSGWLVEIGGDRLVSGNASAVTMLDRSTGDILWQRRLGPFNTWASAGGVIGDGGADAPTIQGVDFATGALLDRTPVPVTAQGTTNAASIVDGTDVFSAAALIQTQGWSIALRRTSGETGQVIWDANEPIDGFDQPLVVANPSVVAHGGAVVWASAINLGIYSQNAPGMLKVGAQDSSTGAPRWSVLLSDIDQRYTIGSVPELDADGNVFVAIGANVVCANGTECQRWTLYKLDGANGNVLWRNDRSAQSAIDFQTTPYPFVLEGGDVGIVDSQSTASIVQRLAGANGEVLWSSDAFASDFLGSIEALADGSFIVLGSERWAKLDGATGATLWSGAWSMSPCTTRCFLWDHVVLPDGSLLYAGEGDYAPLLIRLRGDGSGIVDRWQPEPPDPALSSRITSIHRDDDGQIWVRLLRIHRTSADGVRFLARIDLGTGLLSGQQALYGNDDALGATDYQSLLRAPAENRVLVGTYRVNPPEPTTSGVALLDLGVSATGDLIAGVTVDRTQVYPGDTVAFLAQATYTGDQPIEGAHLVVNLPWSSGATDLACNTPGASHCEIDARSGNVHVAFAATPGTVVEVSGRIRVADAFRESPVVAVSAYGPVELVEANTMNNFALSQLTQGLFRGGFEDP